MSRRILTHGVRVDPDERRVRVLLEGAADSAHRLQCRVSPDGSADPGHGADQARGPLAHQRVVAANRDGELAIARVLVNALRDLLVDLEGVEYGARPTCGQPHVLGPNPQRERRLRTLLTSRGFLRMPMSGSGLSDTSDDETSVSAPAKSTFQPRFCASDSRVVSAAASRGVHRGRDAPRCRPRGPTR